MTTKTATSIKLSIVIPVYNAGKTIDKLVDELIKVLNPHYLLEIVLVNDNSADNSEEICISLHHKHNDIVKFYSLSKNVGEHGAVMAGLNKTTGEYVVILDDDCQNPTSEIIKLVNTIKDNNHDVVYSFYEKKKDTLFKNLGSWFNDKAANLMLNKPKDLYLSSFKIMNRFLINEVIKYQSPFPYIDGIILQITNNIGKVKVDHHERKEGQSGYTLKKLISLWLNMFTNFSILPLRFTMILGFIFALFGLLLGAFYIIQKARDPNLPEYFPTIIVSISIFAGVQLIALGMLGEYIGRVFLSLNRKPQYTIKKKFE